MNLKLADIREHWDNVKEGLEHLKSRFDLPWKPEDVYSACRTGSAFLYVAPEGFMVMQELTCEYSAERYLHVWIAYAPNGIDAIDRYMPELDMISRQYGYRRVTIASSRAGWRKRPEWKELMTTYEHTVT